MQSVIENSNRHSILVLDWRIKMVYERKGVENQQLFTTMSGRNANICLYEV